MKRSAVLAGLAVAMLLVTLAPARPAYAATYTKMVRYGPFTVSGGSATEPGMIVNQLKLGVQRACVDCYFTSFAPDLIYADGTRATLQTGMMLHHFVLASQFSPNATCGSTWLGLFGERFFASGNERTAIGLPAGYGYRVRWYDSWKSVATLDPTNVHNVLGMSTWVGDPLAVLRWGETVRLHSMYQSSHEADDVMGIMLGYINPT